MGIWAHAVVNLLVALGMLAIIPLGLRLIGQVPWWWFAGAVPGAISLFLPRGQAAAALALVYFVVTLLVATRAVHERRIAIITALVSPVVASVSLVAERAEYQLMGFELDVLVLTVAHFHYAGFAAALIAGLVSRMTDRPLATVAAWTVPLGTGIVFAGYFSNDFVELAGAAVLTAGMWLTGWLTWRYVRPKAKRQGLLNVSAGVLVLTMVLALIWALGEAIGTPHLSWDAMVMTHGVANALGFALCAMLAWQGLAKEGQ
ncbi:YndJ family protein [Catelliglobosispora koreensis]|uniref:YndJ family protein n=1 Tax=Catelliglobosispora koreensis TaxID=129052 RepID=UPI00036235FA|nr:YndJ family protein [Catelliglobosispora koreensis]